MTFPERAQHLGEQALHLRVVALRTCERRPRAPPDESQVLGCVYLNPSETHDVRVRMWVRRSAWEDGLDPLLERAVRAWVATSWPFERVDWADREGSA